VLLEAIQDIRMILKAFIQSPTHCKDLVSGWPDYIGVDASSHCIGGVVVGDLSELLLTIFCIQWPMEISEDLVSFKSLAGKINNSDLEMVGLLFFCRRPIILRTVQEYFWRT
jgi:hypothetical protein